MKTVDVREGKVREKKDAPRMYRQQPKVVRW